MAPDKIPGPVTPLFSRLQRDCWVGECQEDGATAPPGKFGASALPVLLLPVLGLGVHGEVRGAAGDTDPSPGNRSGLGAEVGAGGDLSASHLVAEAAE